MITSLILPSVLCILPLVFCAVLFAAGFKVKPLYILLAVLLGFITIFPISVVRYFLPSFASKTQLMVLIKSLILCGLLEELIKCALLFPLPAKNNTLKDYILLSFIAGLTLGCGDGIIYFIDYLSRAAERGATLLYGPLFLKLASIELIQMACSGLLGIFIYTCKQKKPKIMALVYAIVLHGFYDFFGNFKTGLKVFVIIVILLALMECRIFYKNLSEEE